MHTADAPEPSPYFGDDLRFFLFLKELGFSPNVVFDIGASTGVWSEQMHQVFPHPRYHLFEPLADRVPEYTTDLNDRLGRLPELRLHRTALGDGTGAKRLFVTHDGYSSSFLDRGQHEEVLASIKEVIDVPVSSLDEYVSAHHLPDPDLIKIDCQGYEVKILQGAVRCLKSALVLHRETWISPEYGPETPLLSTLTTWLHEREFSLIGFGKHFLDSQHRLYSANAYFFSEDMIERCWPDRGGSKVRRRVLRSIDTGEDIQK